MKSFAVDSNIQVPAECIDIEDLSTKKCPKTGQTCSGSCKKQQPKGSQLYPDGSRWSWPVSLGDLFAALQGAVKEKLPYMLVAGNTAHGVYRRSPDIKAFIDVSGLAELKGHKLSADNSSLTLGGNLSLSETMELCRQLENTKGFEYLSQVWQHLDWIANVPVRNVSQIQEV